MQLEYQQPINAPRDVVFAALNNPEILQQCIPGCKTLNKISDTEMEATVTLKIGPIKANFKGAVVLSNLNPPESYTISGEGKGGPAGFARGGADIKLVEDGDATVLHYSVNADIGGKLAQLGGRLIDSTAKKLASQFFEKFGEIVEAGAEGNEDIPPPSQTETAKESGSGTSRLWIYAGLAAAAIALIYIVAG